MSRRIGTVVTVRKEPHVQPPSPGFAPLSKREIDRRIERLMTEVAAPAPHEDGAPQGARLRWIHPRDLVARLKPFLGQN